MTNVEEKQLEIYQEELQRKSRLENNESLLDFRDIAVLTSYSLKTVRDDLTKRPGFPSPSIGTRYKCGRVKAYLNQVSKQSH